MPSNLPPLGWVSVCEPETTGSASGALPSRRMKRLPTGSRAAVKPRPRAHSTRTRRASLSLASSASRRTPPRGVAPSFAIAMWRCHSRFSSTEAAAFAAEVSVLFAPHSDNAIRSGAANQGAGPPSAFGAHAAGEERGDRGGAREIDRKAALEPQIFCRLAHLLVADQHDFLDMTPDNVEIDRLGLARCHRRHDRGDLRQLDDAAGGEAGVQRRPADRLGADDADLWIERLRRRRDAGDQPAAADGHDQRVDRRIIGEQLKPEGALPGPDPC